MIPELALPSCEEDLEDEEGVEVEEVGFNDPPRDVLNVDVTDNVFARGRCVMPGKRAEEREAPLLIEGMVGRLFANPTEPGGDRGGGKGIEGGGPFGTLDVEY